MSIFRCQRKSFRTVRIHVAENINDPVALEALSNDMETYRKTKWKFGKGSTVTNPSLHSDIVGSFKTATKAEAEKAVTKSANAFGPWSKASANDRVKILNKTADLYEENHA